MIAANPQSRRRRAAARSTAIVPLARLSAPGPATSQQRCVEVTGTLGVATTDPIAGASRHWTRLPDCRQCRERHEELGRGGEPQAVAEPRAIAAGTSGQEGDAGRDYRRLPEVVEDVGHQRPLNPASAFPSGRWTMTSTGRGRDSSFTRTCSCSASEDVQPPIRGQQACGRSSGDPGTAPASIEG